MTSRWWVGALVLAAAWGGAGRAPAADPSAPKPNVVVILADDMGYSDLGCYGGEIKTPNLDALAAGGLRFTQFYNTARCCPTRDSLLTGLYPHQAGVGHMTDDKGDKFPGYRGELNKNCLTLAEALKPAGYRGYIAGKWHVCRNADVRPDGSNHNWPLQRGFDRFYGMVSGGGSFYDPWTLTRDNRLISPYADPDYKPKEYYFTDAITDHAVRFVGDHARDHAGKPFLLYVGYTAAHWPMHALPDDVAKYKGKYDAGYEPIRKARFERATKLGLTDAKQGLPPPAESWDKVANKAREAACMEVYAAMVDRMDQGVGKLVAELKRTGQLDNTLILYLQDNGGCAEEMGRNAVANRVDGPRPEKPTLPPLKPEALPAALVPPQTRDGYPVRQGPNVMPGPYDTYVAYGRGWANVSNTPLREFKHWVHEGGIATPLIAHWPKGIAAKGELRTTPGHLIDVMATCVDVAGAKYPAKVGDRAVTPLEGKSLVPAFADKPVERDALYWEHEGNRAVRVGDLKLVAKGPGGAWELYDLTSDRLEAHDLAAKQPEKVKELTAKWEAWAKRAHVLPWVWTPAYGVAAQAKLAEADMPEYRAAAEGRWPADRANKWLDKHGWLAGANYLPSSAINQLEMWQADTFDPKAIDRELGWAASLGFNSMRVFLHDLLWEQDKKGFLERMEKFLEIADKHKIGVVFVLFDSVWDPNPKLGKQRDPKPGLHNSGWVQGPGAEVLQDPKKSEALKAYVTGVVGHFRDDRRVQAWDVWNEPNNLNENSYGKQEPKDKPGLVRPLLVKTFAWAREAKPTQPLTCGVWQGNWADPEKLRPMEQIQLDLSDVISFHNYGKLDDLKACVKNLRRYGRPLLCTEFMARGNGSTFDPHLAYLKEERVAAHCWGLVDGKSQTIYPWDSWKTPYKEEPKVWFHDVFRKDGTPYRREEVEYIRRVTGAGR